MSPKEPEAAPSKAEMQRCIEVLQDHPVGEKVKLTVADQREVALFLRGKGLELSAQHVESLKAGEFEDWLVNCIYG